MDDKRVHYLKRDWGSVLSDLVVALGIIALVVLAIFGVIYLSGTQSNTHDIEKTLKQILTAIQAVAPCVCPIA